MTEYCTSLEEHFIEGPWVMDDTFSICDPYLFSIAAWLESDGVDMDQFQKITDHQKAMITQNSVNSVMQQLQSG